MAIRLAGPLVWVPGGPGLHRRPGKPVGGLGPGSLLPHPGRGWGAAGERWTGELSVRLPAPSSGFVSGLGLADKCEIRSLKEGTIVTHGDLQTVLELTWEERSTGRQCSHENGQSVHFLNHIQASG